MPYETDHHPRDGPPACEPTHAWSATSTSMSNAFARIATIGLQQTVAAGLSHFVLQICLVRFLRLPSCAHPLDQHQRAAQPPMPKTTHPSWNHLRFHGDLTPELQVASTKNHTSLCPMLPMTQNHTSCTLTEWMTRVRHCNGQLERNHGQQSQQQWDANPRGSPSLTTTATTSLLST